VLKEKFGFSAGRVADEALKALKKAE